LAIYTFWPFIPFVHLYPLAIYTLWPFIPFGHLYPLNISNLHRCKVVKHESYCSCRKIENC